MDSSSTAASHGPGDSGDLPPQRGDHARIDAIPESAANASSGEGVRKGTVLAFIQHWLREPLVQFILIALLLFVGYSLLHPNALNQAYTHRIELTQDDLRQLQIVFEAQWKRQPTPQEMAGLIEQRVHQEVLYREALAMGLDREDTIVKRRMAQKMEFLAEDLADLHEPTTRELSAWFAKHSSQFAQPAHVTFRHIYFSPDSRGQHAHDDAVRALGELAGKPEDSPLVNKVGDPFMFQSYYPDRNSDEISKDFGPEFTAALLKLKPGSWQGPIQSGFGWHLVWIDEVTPQRIPSFEEVEPEVKLAWTAEQREKVQRMAYQEMRSHYTVVLPKGTAPEAK